MDIPTHYNYTVSVDEEARVAHALDERGAVLVSLDYSDEAELCSDEFQRCLSDAVALMHLDLGVKEEQCGGGDDVMMEIWREEMAGGTGVPPGNKMDDTGTMHVGRVFDDEAWRMEESDRDFALALWEQEREEQMAAEEKKKKKKEKKESVWGTRMMHEDSSLGMFAASGPPLGYKEEDFPHLDVHATSRPVMETFEPTGTLLKSMTRQEHKVHLYMDDEIPSAMEDWKAVRSATATATEDEVVEREECNRHRLGKDDREYILSSVAARETAGHGVSPESLKTMMAASSRSTSGKQEDTPNDSNYIDRERYSRKSIRKLVLDMIQAGWNPMPGRGGGHYMYERKVSVPGGSPITQILVIPSTPSSQKSIDRVYAKLMKCDREVSEKRMMMAKNASTQK
ncbi:hypothetical protein M9435_001535 [Picochlorum sp. BPE23]|nr:hypothetical protein M9435_001535 [Picochlorum sp. BPE23]